MYLLLLSLAVQSVLINGLEPLKTLYYHQPNGYLEEDYRILPGLVHDLKYNKHKMLDDLTDTRYNKNSIPTPLDDLTDLRNEYKIPKPVDDLTNLKYNKDRNLVPVDDLRNNNELIPISIDDSNKNYLANHGTEVDPVKAQYDAIVDEVHTKYVNRPKQKYIIDREKLHKNVQKLKRFDKTNFYSSEPEADPVKAQYNAIVDEVHTKYLNRPKPNYMIDKEKFKNINDLNRYHYVNLDSNEPQVDPVKSQYDAIVDEVHTKYLNRPTQKYMIDKKKLHKNIQKSNIYDNNYSANPISKVDPVKAQYDAIVDEVHTKYLNRPKQNYKIDREKLHINIQKLKTKVANPNTPTRLKKMYEEIIKIFTAHKDSLDHKYELNENIEKLMNKIENPNTPYGLKKFYEELLETYHRHKILTERSYGYDSRKENYFIQDFTNPNYNLKNGESKNAENGLNYNELETLSEGNPRRFLSWLHSLFSKSNSSNTSTSTTTQSTPPTAVYSTKEYSTKEYTTYTTEMTFKSADLQEKRDHIENVVSEILKNITEILENLNRSIEKQNKLTTIIFNNVYSRLAQQTMTRERNRYKRDLNSKNNTEKVDKNATLATNVTESLNNTCNCTEPNGRRMYGLSDEEPTSPVKARLLAYLNETFQEITAKIEPIIQLKEQYKANNMFKVGYIVANIDTLEVNIIKLKNDMDINKDQWDDRIVLDLFDKVMMANKVINNLLAALQAYTKYDPTVVPQDLHKETNEIGLPTVPPKI